MIFKCLNGLAPPYLQELIKFKPNPRCLRSSFDKTLLYIPRKRLITIGDRSFEFFGPKTWNSLPIEIRELQSIDSFKKAVKTFYFLASYKNLALF